MLIYVVLRSSGAAFAAGIYSRRASTRLNSSAPLIYHVIFLPRPFREIKPLRPSVTTLILEENLPAGLVLRVDRCPTWSLPVCTCVNWTSDVVRCPLQHSAAVRFQADFIVPSHRIGRLLVRSVFVDWKSHHCVHNPRVDRARSFGEVADVETSKSRYLPTLYIID